MKIDVKCELPFEWCGECPALDLETADSYSTATGPERSYLCRHADSCECGEAAARRWREEVSRPVIEVTSQDPAKRGALAELVQKSKVTVIGMDQGAGADQAAGITKGDYLRRVLPGMSDEKLSCVLSFIPCPSCPEREDCKREGEEIQRRGGQTERCSDRWRRWMKETVK